MQRNETFVIVLQNLNLYITVTVKNAHKYCCRPLLQNWYPKSSHVINQSNMLLYSVILKNDTLSSLAVSKKYHNQLPGQLPFICVMGQRLSIQTIQTFTFVKYDHNMPKSPKCSFYCLVLYLDYWCSHFVYNLCTIHMVLNKWSHRFLWNSHQTGSKLCQQLIYRDN